jgi:response regulator RpfG family c-di-GMP phosphodiesterase
MADLHRGSLLHDIGKMGIPDIVLLKAASSAPRNMNEGPPGYNDLLAHILSDRVLDIAYRHHEDGTAAATARIKGDIYRPARLLCGGRL